MTEKNSNSPMKQNRRKPKELDCRALYISARIKMMTCCHDQKARSSQASTEVPSGKPISTWTFSASIAASKVFEVSSSRKAIYQADRNLTLKYWADERLGSVLELLMETNRDGSSRNSFKPARIN